MMKTLAFLLLLTSAALVQAEDNLLQNGDFSDGVVHWYGNVRTPDDTTETGATIKLRPRDWTTATQDFQIKAGTYKLHFSFALSADVHFSTDLTDYINIPVRLNFPVERPVDISAGQWAIVVADPAASKSLSWMVTPSHASGPQSYTVTIKDIDFNNKQTLMIAFPPGSGLVTLQHVSLVPSDAH